MLQQLSRLVLQLHVAADRRPPGTEQAARLAEVLAILDREHGQDPSGQDPENQDPENQDLLEGRLADLAVVFGLTELDLRLLVVACAPDLDANLGLAFALLQGDAARNRPGVGLALELSEAPVLSAQARSRIGPSAPLPRHGLLLVVGEEPLLQRPLRVPDRVVAHLLGDDTPDPAVAAMVVTIGPAVVPEALAVARAISLGVPLVWIRTKPGGQAYGLATAALDLLSIHRLVVDLARSPAGASLGEAVRGALREAGLRRAGLVLSSADLLTDVEHRGLLPLLENAPVPVLAIARRSWDASWLGPMPFCVDAPLTGADVRDGLWRELLGEQVGPGGPGWAELVSLRLTPQEIAQTAGYASVIAGSRGQDPSIDAVREAARRLSVEMTGARQARGAPTFEDLVLPPLVLGSLKELVGWARHRDEVLAQGSLAGKGDKGRGIAALFSGSPGTGKTLAAHVIAAELGLDLHTVDLSSIVDKYIGETEKNLEKVFDEAESLNVLLFFDEADALFGARSEVKDARDRYANQEVAYLLQRMEQFDGIVVLATNLRGNLDVAFSRRLHFIINFPDPDLATRRQLWQTHLRAVPSTDPADPVDLDHLADTVEMAGGDIRNVVLAAAYAAVAHGELLGMRHVVRAVVREYRKLGRRLPVPGLRLPE